MKKSLILVFVYLLILNISIVTVSSANIKPCFDDIPQTTELNMFDENLVINDSYDIESIEVLYNNSSCTVTVTGSIGISGTSISVSISVTADTCGEAIEEAIEAYKELRSQILELLFSIYKRGEAFLAFPLSIN